MSTTITIGAKRETEITVAMTDRIFKSARTFISKSKPDTNEYNEGI